MKRSNFSRSGLVTFRALLGGALLMLGLTLALIAMGMFTGTSTMAQSRSGSIMKNGMRVIPSYHNDRSRPLREMAKSWRPQVLQEHEAAENPRIANDHVNGVDPVVQNKMGTNRLGTHIPSPLISFDGVPFPGVGCSCAPPDTNGEVGDTQFVQIVNEGYQVFDKATGNSVMGPTGISAVWSGFGGVCQTGGFGDPVMLYDQIANRWLISQFAGGGSVPTDECVAVSTSDDATGTYNRYGYHLGSNFYDYPKLSVWPDAYYMSMNVFNSGGTARLGSQGFAFDRNAMLAGTPATIIATAQLSSSLPLMLPADLDGSTLPPAGAPNSFVFFPSSNTYRVYHFHVDFATPANATFTSFAAPAAASFTQLCASTRACVPELGVTAANYVDGIGDRLMHRLAYRNFGDHESLVGNFTVKSNNVAGIRWFELRNVTSGPVTVYQESTYQPDTTYRWMGSIAMDGAGDIALGFSASSSTINPQIRYAGRLASDPINTLAQGEAHLYDGTGSQTGTGNRWGDYSALSVDPVDDSTFWYTQEYYATNGTYGWRTRIGSFKMASPVSPQLVSAVSRLTHGSAGTFDVNMPLTGTTGVEDRQASTYNIVLTFDSAVTSGSATVTSGTGTAGAATASGNTLTVPLTGITNADAVTLTLNNINGLTVSTSVDLGFLLGDTNADRFTNAGDTTQVRSLGGQTVDGTNFRADVNLDGFINGGDATVVRSNSGNAIP